MASDGSVLLVNMAVHPIAIEGFDLSFDGVRYAVFPSFRLNTLVEEVCDVLVVGAGLHVRSRVGWKLC